MWSTLKTALTSILLFIALCFGANAAVTENHALGDFLAAQHYTDQNPEANQLASLESFGFYQKHASECCNATNNVGGTNIRAVDPSAANAGDRLPPYNPNAPIRDFDADGTTTYVRVYTEGQTGQHGSWMMRPSDIEGLSPQQIQDRFDLPYAPTHVTDVTPPAGTPIRTGTVNEGNFGGNGGGTQFELIGDDYIPSGSFTNPRPLQ